MKNYIIGIAGKKNSGKDTIADMINYIFAIGITKASYVDYISKRMSIKITHNDRIIHFADGVKDVLSIIYNITRSKFDDRECKDDMYYNLKSGKFFLTSTIENQTNVEIITIDRLKKSNINAILKCSKDKLVYIKLRTLMQYFGTDICRDKLADDIWIRHTISKAIDIAESRRICIIPDIRFANEAKAIKNHDCSLYGGVIMVKREQNDSLNKTKHSSEIIDVNADFTIDNNGSLMILFYKVLNICQQMI